MAVKPGMSVTLLYFGLAEKVKKGSITRPSKGNRMRRQFMSGRVNSNKAVNWIPAQQTAERTFFLAGINPHDFTKSFIIIRNAARRQLRCMI